MMARSAQNRPSLSSVGPDSDTEARLPLMAQYAITLLLVAAAAFLAFPASSVVPTPGLTLIFVLPVVIAGSAYGLGPSVAATVASVLAFDFFFTQPYLTLRITDASDIWTAGLLLVTAAIVSTVAWQSRRHALEARRAAAHAEELRLLAHAVIDGGSQAQIVEAATAAVGRMFGAPAVILSDTGGRLRVESTAGDAQLSEAETDAARGALTHGIHMRANTYPYEQSRFDMWPVATSMGCQYVVGVDFGRAAYERPSDADRLVEIVTGYVVGNLARASL
jgi:K+-sensing histidine kinase KdpD